MDNKLNNISKNSILVIVTLTSFLSPFMGTSINIALPTIAKELSVDAILLSWITASFLLSSAMFAVPFGKIADIYGMRKIFTYGAILFSIGTLVGATAISVEFLIVGRIIQGLACSMILVTGLAIISQVFPIKERGKAVGINITTLYLGLILGPVLGGFLTNFIGWRSIFYMIFILSLIIVGLIFWKMREGEWTEGKGDKFDYIGSIIYVIMLGLILLGFSNITSINGIILVILGIVLLLIFIKWELNVQTPVLDLSLFRNRTFAFSNLATVISYIGLYGVGYLMSLYLQYIKGFNPSISGMILVTQAVFMMLLSPIAGRLSDKYDPGKIASIGMGIMSIGLMILALINEDTNLYILILGLGVLGFGVGLFSAPNTNAIMSSVEKKFYGAASATLSTMRLLGQTFGMGLVLIILAIFLGAVQINPSNYGDLLNSIRLSFFIAVLLSIIAIFASLARNKRGTKYGQ